MQRRSKLTSSIENSASLQQLDDRTQGMRSDRPRPLCDPRVDSPRCRSPPALKPLVEQDANLLNQRQPSYIGARTKRDLGAREMAAFQVFRPQGKGNVSTPHHARRVVDDMPDAPEVCDRKVGPHLQDYMQGTTLPKCSAHTITGDQPLKYDFSGNSTIDQAHLDRLAQVWDGNSSRRFTFGVPN